MIILYITFFNDIFYNIYKFIIIFYNKTYYFIFILLFLLLFQIGAKEKLINTILLLNYEIIL